MVIINVPITIILWHKNIGRIPISTSNYYGGSDGYFFGYILSKLRWRQ